MRCGFDDRHTPASEWRVSTGPFHPPTGEFRTINGTYGVKKSETAEEYQRSTMSITVVQQEPQWLIRLAGELNSAGAADLRTLLLGWVAAGKSIELDCSGVSELDVTILQLLEAARREAGQGHLGFGLRASAAVTTAVGDAGFRDLGGCLEVVVDE